jgi:toxin CptA
VLKIGLRPSRLMAGILILAHGAAMAIVMLAAIPLWAKIIATGVLLVQLPIIVRRRALLLAPDAAVAIEAGPDNAIAVQTLAGAYEECEVLGGTYVMPYLTILSLRRLGSGASMRIALLPDSLQTEDFRQLRVWLRWKQDGSKS